MDDPIMKYVISYATYSDIFGEKYDPESLKKFIKEVPLGGILHILSQLCSFSRVNVEDLVMKENFIALLETQNPGNFRIRQQLTKHILYSPQSLLTVWKWLLVYGDESKLDTNVKSIEQGLNIIIFISIVVSDYIDEEAVIPDLEYEWVRNVVFNNQPDIVLSIARAAWIYSELAKDSSKVNSNEYVDINTDFEAKYHYSIKYYLAVVIGVYSLFFDPRKNIEIGWTKHIDIVFSETAINEKAKEIIEPLLLDFKTAREWALKTLNLPWDFLLFNKKPLFQIDSKKFYPINARLLNEHLFMGLFYKIEACYSEGTKFRGYFGRPFESYASLLMQ